MIENTWLPMQDSPKDGTPVLLKLKDDLSQYSTDTDWLDTWNGMQFVGCREKSAFAWSFAAPVGCGGFPDPWFVGWKPLE